MKRLFYLSISLLILFFSCQTSDSLNQKALNDAYNIEPLSAIEVYENISLEKMDYRVLYNLIYSYIEVNELEKALDLTDYAISKFSDYLRFYYIKAYILKEKGFINQYNNTLKSILEIDKGNISVYTRLINSLLLLGQRDEATKFAKELLELDITNVDALYALSFSSPFYNSIKPERKETRKETIEEKDYSLSSSYKIIKNALDSDKKQNLVSLQIISLSDYLWERLLKNNNVISEYKKEEIKKVDDYKTSLDSVFLEYLN